MLAFDILQQRVRQSALELELAILAKAEEMRDAALHGQTQDDPKVLQIARYLEATVFGGRADRTA